MQRVWQRLYAWWHASLRRQLVLPVVLVALLGSLVAGAFTVTTARRVVQRQVDAERIKLARLGADEVSQLFQDVIDIARLQQRQMLSSTAADQADALVALQRQFPEAYSSLLLLDDQGRTLLVLSRGSTSTVGTPQVIDPPQPFVGAPELLAAIRAQQVYVSPVDYQSITSTPVVTVAIPLITSAAEGTLVIEVDARYFWKRSDTLDVEAGNAVIVDEQGVILAHPDRQRIGQPVDPALQEFVRSRTLGSARYTAEDTAYVATYAPLLGVMRWGVVIEQDRRAILTPVRNIAQTLLLIIGIGALVVGLLLSLLIRAMLRPVAALSAQAAAISASDATGQTFATLRKDELGVLAVSLNQMLARLGAAQTQVQQLNVGLEQQIADRTAELQAALAEIQARSQQQEQLLALVRRLSMPIIPITDAIVVAPLVGEISAARAQELIGILLKAIEQQQVRVAIIDITGVPVIDPDIAHAFVRLAYGARLLGASAILAGIRPEIAQVLVTIDVDLVALETAATLAQGFARAKQLTGQV